MKVVRHCTERLPHGEAEWQKAAKIAGFNGTLHVGGLGHDPNNYRELDPKRRKKWGYTVGWYDWRTKDITVRLHGAPCARTRGLEADRYDAMKAFFHELGHYRQDIRGVNLQTSNNTWGKTYTYWRTNHLEMSAERYANRMLKRLGWVNLRGMTIGD